MGTQPISKIQLGANTKSRLLQLLAPKMDAYITVHGYEPAKLPIVKSMQVAKIKDKYAEKFRDMKKKLFGFDEDFQHFAGTDDYHFQLEEFTADQEAENGFRGFDGEDGENVSHITPLAETYIETPEGFDLKKAIGSVGKIAGGVAGATPYGAIAKAGGKLLGGAVKTIGATANKKVDDKKAVSAQAAAISNDAKLKQAHAKALKAGVPPAQIERILKDKVDRKEVLQVGGHIIQRDTQNSTKTLEELTKVFQASKIKDEGDKWKQLGVFAIIMMFLIYIAVKTS